MTTVASFREGPWAPVKTEIGGRVFWLVVNRSGQRLAETEENAKIIADAANAAFRQTRPAVEKAEGSYDGFGL